jgi:CheY-like chemotaxis protein
MRVLIVEDDAIMGLHLQLLVQKLGHEVVGLAATGEEAVTTEPSVHPDVIFMDIQLRGSVSGWDAAAAIRARSSVPIVFITAYGDNPASPDSMPSGSLRLTKPVHDAELRACLEQLPRIAAGLPRSNLVSQPTLTQDSTS